MNQSDSERIRSVIEGVGFEMTDREEEASLIGIVACSVRQKAIDKVTVRSINGINGRKSVIWLPLFQGAYCRQMKRSF